MKLNCSGCGNEFDTNGLEEFCPACVTRASSHRNPAVPPIGTPPPMRRVASSSSYPRPSTARRTTQSTPPRNNPTTLIGIGVMVVAALAIGGYVFLSGNGGGSTSNNGTGGTEGPDGENLGAVIDLHRTAILKGMQDPRAVTLLEELTETPARNFLRGVFALEKAMLPYGPFGARLHAYMTQKFRLTQEVFTLDPKPTESAWKAAADAARADIESDPGAVLPEEIVARGRAMLALAEGRFDRARNLLSDHADTDDGCRAMMAWVHMASSTLAAAERQLEGGGTSHVLRLVRAQIAILRDRRAVAATETELILGRANEHEPARHIRALARSLQNRNDDLARLSRKKPGDIVLLHARAEFARHRNDWREIDAVQSRIIDRIGDDHPVVYWPRAIARMYLSRFDGAQSDTKPCASALKSVAGYFLLRAQVADSLGRYKEAIEEAGRGLAVAPSTERPALLQLRAFLHLTLGDEKKGNADLKQLTSLSPRAASFRLWMNLYNSENEWEDVVKVVRLWIEKLPRDAEAHAELGLALYRMKKFAESYSAFGEAAKLDGRPAYIANRGQARHRIGGKANLESGLADVERAWSREFRGPDLLLERIHLHIELGKLATAAKLMGTLNNQYGNRLNPGQFGRREALLAWASLSDPKKAGEHIRRAAERGFNVLLEIDDPAAIKAIRKLPEMAEAEKRIEKMLENQTKANADRPFLGVLMNDRTGIVRIVHALRGHAARKSGIRPGDRIVSVNGSAVSTNNQLATTLGEHKPGDEVKLLLERAPGTPFAHKIERTVTMGRRPSTR